MAKRKAVDVEPLVATQDRPGAVGETADEDLIDDWFEPEDAEDLPPADAARRDELEEILTLTKLSVLQRTSESDAVAFGRTKGDVDWAAALKRQRAGDLARSERLVEQIGAHLAAFAKMDAEASASLAGHIRRLLQLARNRPPSALDAWAAVRTSTAKRTKTARSVRNQNTPYILATIEKIAESWYADPSKRHVNSLHGLAVQILPDVQKALKELEFPENAGISHEKWPPTVKTVDTCCRWLEIIAGKALD
jgi:hypothetical protein